jgi:hypothetical protein
MKRIAILAASVLVAMSCAQIASATGTASNWSTELTFSTDKGDKDILPILIGENTLAEEKLKPPSMPGITYDTNYDAVVYGFVVNSQGVGAAKSIGVPATDNAGKIWAVKVNVEVKDGEGTKKVSLTADMTDFYDGYDLSAINPDTGAIVSFTKSANTQEIFTTDASAEKTVFIVAGKSMSFLSSYNGKVFGAVRKTKNTKLADGVKVFLDGTQVTTSDKGIFQLDGFAANSSHTIKLDADYALTKTINVTAGSDGSVSVPLADIYGGDTDNSGKIDLKDIKAIKLCFNKTAVDGTCDADKLAGADTNGDGKIDLKDLAAIKVGYSQVDN